MFQKILLLMVTVGICSLIIGVFIGTALANYLPKSTGRSIQVDSSVNVKMENLKQALIQEENRRQNCEASLARALR
ncbi:MAG: hypothetical protein WDW19_04205 [Neisseriaceae bacterium]